VWNFLEPFWGFSCVEKTTVTAIGKVHDSTPKDLNDKPKTPSPLSSGELSLVAQLTNDYRRKMMDTREYPQYFTKQS
jgi:hypothetical protein